MVVFTDLDCLPIILINKAYHYGETYYVCFLDSVCFVFVDVGNDTAAVTLLIISLMIFCRYSLLRLHGNACRFLHKCHKHPSRHQWHRVRSSPVYLWLHHRLQPDGAQWCVADSSLITCITDHTLKSASIGHGELDCTWKFLTQVKIVLNYRTTLVEVISRFRLNVMLHDL